MGWLAAGLGAAVLNLVLALLANSHEPCYAGNKCKGPPGDAAEVKQSSVHVSAASMCLQCHIAYAVNKATLHVCIATPATLLSLSVLLKAAAASTAQRLARSMGCQSANRQPPPPFPSVASGCCI